MGAAADASVPRTRITSTTVKETLPASEAARSSEFYDRDFWEVIGSLSTPQWKDHLVRIYRADDRWDNAGSPPENKLKERFSEETIFAKWGGGRYNLWLYGPPDGVTVVMRPYHLELEGAPKTPSAGPVTVAAAPGGGSMELLIQELLNEVRQRGGGDLTQQAMKNALEIQAAAMKSGIETMRVAVGPLGAPQQQQPDLFREIVSPLLTALIPALINKFTNPANPLEDIGKVIDTLKTVSGSLGLGVAPKTDIGATLVNNAPALIDRAVNGIREWRLGMEAQAKAVTIQSQSRVIDMPPAAPTPAPTTQAGDDPTAAAPPVAAASSATPPSAAATELTPEARQEIVVDHFFLTVVDQVTNHPESTGEDLYEYLRANLPAIVDQVKSLKPEEIIQIFRTTRILNQIADHPRLPKMIEEFLAAAKADVE